MSAPRVPRLGVGIGWRRELALEIERCPKLGFVEVMAENLDPRRGVPQALAELRSRGVKFVSHSVSLSLGGAEAPDKWRLQRLAWIARELRAPVVSDHIAFVRAGGMDSGHLLPVPRTRDALEVMVENVRAARAVLPVPLALENIATLFQWPGAEMTEAEFITELLDRTGALLLLDVANLYANCRNEKADPVDALDELPLDRIAYVHVAGGMEHAGLYHDTHAHPVPRPVFGLLRELRQRLDPPGVMLERDDRFPRWDDVETELDAIESALRSSADSGPPAKEAAVA